MVNIPVAIPSNDVELLPWFQPHFETVFVLLHPFFAVSPDVYQQFTLSNAVPTRQEWRTLAKPITWSEMTTRVGFSHRGSLHTTLLQRFGAIRPHDTEAIHRLEQYLAEHHYLEPTNGTFDELLLDSMLDACALNDQSTVYLASAFDSIAHERSIAVLRSDPDARLGMVEPVLWTIDQTVLFCVHWDSFYTCVAGPRTTLTTWAKRYAWEGFFAEPGMMLFWEEEPGAKN